MLHGKLGTLRLMTKIQRRYNMTTMNRDYYDKMFKHHPSDLPELNKSMDSLVAEIREQVNKINDFKRTDGELPPESAEETAKLLQLNKQRAELQEIIDRLQKASEIGTYMSKLDAIMDKNNCLSVRFLDWLANKIETSAARWTAKLRNYAMSISKPCAVKLPKSKLTPFDRRKKEAKAVFEQAIKNKEAEVSFKKMMAQIQKEGK